MAVTQIPLSTINRFDHSLAASVAPTWTPTLDNRDALIPSNALEGKPGASRLQALATYQQAINRGERAFKFSMFASAAMLVGTPGALLAAGNGLLMTGCFTALGAVGALFVLIAGSVSGVSHQRMAEMNACGDLGTSWENLPPETQPSVKADATSESPKSA